ncbi:MAG: F0F1 ATP synthase subunit B', partial [Roseiarcus sp.]
EDQLAARLAEAERQIAGTRAEAMTNVSQIAREAAAAIVERLGGRPADPAAVAAAVASVKPASGDA